MNFFRHFAILYTICVSINPSSAVLTSPTKQINYNKSKPNYKVHSISLTGGYQLYALTFSQLDPIGLFLLKLVHYFVFNNKSSYVANAPCHVITIRENNIKCIIRFNQSEMKRLYRIFKSECPSGLITEEVFHNIFSKFFPLGAESYNGKRSEINEIHPAFITFIIE